MTETAPGLTAPDPRRWFALVVIAIAQLMVVLDATIVNIALPDAQKDLHISLANRQWIVTAYTLTFGGFLLLGGRIADYAGRKRVFVISLILFAGASALGGFAPTQGTLFAARALQGLFAAALAPAALSLVSVTFTDSKERAKAFAVYGGLSGVGATIGLIAGGILTSYASWRWCLFVNVPMALIAVALAIPNIRESKLAGRTKYDIPGAILSTAGLLSIVYGMTEAALPGHGWSSGTTIGFLVGGIVLLMAFIAWETRADKPLLPLGVILERIRGGSYLAMFFVSISLFGMFLFMTYYFQGVRHISPIMTGVYFLPFSLGVIVSATAASSLLPKVGPRPLGSLGMIAGAVGMIVLSRITPTSNYFEVAMPAFLIMSLGLGLAFVSASSTSLFNVPFHESGVASAVLNSAQQVGSALGIAFLNTIAIGATTAYAIGHLHSSVSAVSAQNAAQVHGYTTSFLWCGGVFLAAGLIYFFMVNIDRHHLAQHDDVGDPDSSLLANQELATSEES